MIKTLLALILFGVFLGVCSTRADEDHPVIPNAGPAGPEDFAHVPVMWIGVRACGQYVIWLVFDDHISVVDKDHHPKDMKEFMLALETSKIPSDERIIPCSAEDL